MRVAEKNSTGLTEISETLNEHLDLKKSLYTVLDILANSMDMVRDWTYWTGRTGR